MDEPTADPFTDLKRLFFPRPTGQLARFPLEIRWEAVRRHPYYLVFWEAAHRYYTETVSHDNEEQATRYVASFMVQAAGAGKPPVSPALAFEDLGSQALHPAWCSGAIQPPTARFLVASLIRLLPDAERAFIGAVLLTSGQDEYRLSADDELRSLQRLKAFQTLQQFPSPSLDKYVDIPFFYLEMEASQNTIIRDLESLVRYWKQRRNVKEQRVRPEKLRRYLRIWDQREGWTGAGYDRSQEMSFTEIAKSARSSKSTVFSGYRQAFELITGHQFSRDIWQQLFLRLKFSSESTSEHLSKRVRQQLLQKVERPVPDSVISPRPDERGGSIVSTGAIAPDSTEVTDMLLDIETLIHKGRDDDEILGELELPADQRDLVAYVRARLNEFVDAVTGSSSGS